MNKRIKSGFVNLYLKLETKSSSIAIHLDTENESIDICSNFSNTIVIDNPELLQQLVEKWEQVYQKRLDQELEASIQDFFQALTEDDRDLYREWQIRQIEQ